MSPSIQLQAFLSRNTIPQSDESQLVYVMLVATPLGTPVTFSRMPLNICLLLDRSSSMRGDRLFQVKEAARCIVDRLDKNDFFSVITFNDHAQVVIPAQMVRDPVNLKHLINGIEVAGGTEMAQGLEHAAQQVQHSLTLHGINHVILLTDGRTYGDENRCLHIARKMQEQGIGLTALGIGNEWNEDLLELMAASENSTTRYITNAQDITTVFAEEIRRMSSIFAQKVQVLITGHSNSIVRSLDRIQPFIGPISIKGERNVHWIGNVGDWTGTEAQAFLVELVVPPLDIGEHPLLHTTLRYHLYGDHEQEHQSEISLKLAVRSPKQVRHEVDITIRNWLERLTAYRLQARAWKNVETGLIEDAAQQLTMAGTRLFEAGDRDLAHTIQEEASRLLKAGQASAEGRKRIKYGTRGLIHTSHAAKEHYQN
jgi:uncharacterized protein YegL